MPRSNPLNVTVGTEVVCDGIRGVVTAITGGDRAHFEWESYGFLHSRYSSCCVSSIRTNRTPAVVMGFAQVRLARKPNRLQHLLK